MAELNRLQIEQMLIHYVPEISGVREVHPLFLSGWVQEHCGEGAGGESVE